MQETEAKAAHTWDEGETVDGITTYTCTVCDAQKNGARRLR